VCLATSQSPVGSSPDLDMFGKDIIEIDGRSQSPVGSSPDLDLARTAQDSVQKGECHNRLSARVLIWTDC